MPTGSSRRCSWTPPGRGCPRRSGRPSSAGPGRVRGMALRIDHVVWGVEDLDRAAAGVRERHGLASVPGGRHPGWGTANRIIPLGPSYLELLAVADAAEAAADP